MLVDSLSDSGGLAPIAVPTGPSHETKCPQSFPYLALVMLFDAGPSTTSNRQRIPIRPMETADICMVFAYRDSAEKLLEFVERFGLLGDYEGEQPELDGYYQDPVDGSELLYVGSYEGMPVDKYLEQAALFLELLRRKEEGPEQLAAFLKSTGTPRQSLGLVRLIPDRVLGAQFQVAPADLMQALWFQLGQVLASNIKLSTCLQCGQLFEVGQGSGRRADAKYCSDEHRTLYHSLNRKPARRS